MIKSEKELAIEYFNATEIDEDQIRAKVNNKWIYITDLIVEYRKKQKVKKSQKKLQTRYREEFNLQKDTLVSEVENYCKDLFREYPDIIVFINRSSVNVFDPVTQTTAYCMLHYVSHCVNLISSSFSTEELKDFSKSSGYDVANKEEQCLVNHLKETSDVANTIYDILLKLRKL